MGADIGGMRLGLRAVDRQAGVLPPSAACQRQLDVMDVDGAQAPHGGCGPVAEERAWADAQKSGNEAGLTVEASVSDRIDVVVDVV